MPKKKATSKRRREETIMIRAPRWSPNEIAEALDPVWSPELETAWRAMPPRFGFAATRSGRELAEGAVLYAYRNWARRHGAEHADRNLRASGFPEREIRETCLDGWGRLPDEHDPAPRPTLAGLVSAIADGRLLAWLDEDVETDDPPSNDGPKETT